MNSSEDCVDSKADAISKGQTIGDVASIACQRRLANRTSPTSASPLSFPFPDYIYSCKGARRGLCLLVTVTTFEPHLRLGNRPGNEVDVHMVQRTFSNLDFECRVANNPTARELQLLIREISRQDHSDADCFACVILTHGEDGGIIYASDNAIHLDDILTYFRGDACPTLIGKPKLFFIQACRGNKLEMGVMMRDSGDDDLEQDGAHTYRKIPAEADFLLAFSVPPGYYAFRNSARGSWFIQALTDVLAQYGRTLDLLSMLTRVSYRVAYDYESKAAIPEFSGKKQIPCIVSMLTKDLFFPPKS